MYKHCLLNKQILRSIANVTGKGYKAMPITRRNPLPAPQQEAELQKLVCIKIQMQL